MRRTNLRGHALRSEGKPYVHSDEEPWMIRTYSHTGYAWCECGAISTPLSSDSRRKRWHADHKDAMREAR